MIFQIRQNDEKPKLIVTLSADYDSAYPEADQIIYDAGDNVKLYLKKGDWLTRDVTVLEVIDDGRAIKVTATLDASDVEKPGAFNFYLRNETKKLTFPTDRNLQMRVISSGHE